MWSPLQPPAAAGLLLPAPHRVNLGSTGKGEPTPRSNPSPHLWSTGQRTARHILCPAVLLTRVISSHQLQDVPIQPEGLPSDHREILLGLPVNLMMIALAGQMAGVPSGPLQPSTTLPLRYQVGRASEPTLCPEPPSGSPPLLVSSGECRTHRSARD